MGLFDRRGVVLALFVFGQGPVDAGQAGVVAFAFAGGEDDPAVRGVGLDLAALLERGLDRRAHPHAGGDFLGEDFLARDAGRGQGVELGLEFLGQVLCRV